MAVTAQEVILGPVAGLRGGRPPRTASTPDCTCTHARVRHAFPSCGTGGACRLRRSSPSRSALSTVHRGSLAGTSWAWALPGRGSWLVPPGATCSALEAAGRGGQDLGGAHDILAVIGVHRVEEALLDVAHHKRGARSHESHRMGCRGRFIGASEERIGTGAM